jgi:hypothetical protein
MPIEYALVSQFLAFNFLYYADSRATSRGWMPPWYGTYRFVLTFVVGASIVITLIGRGEIADRVKRLPSAVGRIMKGEEGREGLEKVKITLGSDDGEAEEKEKKGKATEEKKDAKDESKEDNGDDEDEDKEDKKEKKD